MVRGRLCVLKPGYGCDPGYGRDLKAGCENVRRPGVVVRQGVDVRQGMGVRQSVGVAMALDPVALVSMYSILMPANLQACERIDRVGWALEDWDIYSGMNIHLPSLPWLLVRL